MKIPISEAILLLLSGILGIIAVTYAWEKLIDFVFAQISKWLYSKKE